ncbi:MAG TPA: choice-of-anchor D domain-containing protein, partial [Kiritimatiellia bacterium]|nr:choice-of-anchor D domain-containing protein [Kiritimatiellia bacterium]
ATNQSGNITVRETDALTLGTVRAATGNVLIGSGNTITVGVVAALGQVVLTNQAGAMVGGVIVSDTGVIFRSLEGISMTVTAPVLQATSLGTGDIDLLTTVDRFSATNVLGDILVVDTTNLLLTGLSALDGDIDVRVLPGSVLSVTNVISTLPGAGGVLTINSGVVLQDGHSIQVGSGNITLEGGSIDIVVNGLMNVSVDTAMRALRDILVVSNGQIVVNGGANLSLYADRDGAMNDDGVFDAFGGIYLGGSGLDALNGGNIILSGHELARGQYETGIAVDPGTGLRIQSLLEGGSGSLLLSSISNVVIQAPVSTTGGNLSILSSAGSIQQQSTLTVGGAGTADLEALGSILMGTNVIQTSGGSVRLAAGDQVEIGLIDAGVGLVSILSGQGDIVTGDSGVLNVIAAGLCLEAGGSVGSNMDPFYTQVGTLAADAGGNLCLVEDNGLTVGTVGPVVVNRLLTNGSLIQVTNAALAGIGVATNLKLIVVGGDILITQEMHSGSDLLVFANGGNVTQDAMIHSTNGNISVLVNNNFGQNADISAGGAGSLDVNVGGTITMASGTQSQAGGNIRYGAGQDVLLGHLSGANVSVVAGRDILDNNAGANNATATGLRMQAGRNIATGADRLETSVDVLAAQAGGSIYVDEANGLTLGTVGPLSVNRVNANSTTTPVTDVLLAGARAGTNLKVTAGGTITVTLPVSAGRELLLETSSGDVIQNAILTSTNGNILASATNGAIFVNALITTEPGSGGTRTVIGEVIGDLDANILLGSGDITLIGRGTVFRLYGTNLAEIVNGELASLDKGTDFGRLMIPNTLVREFRIENAGNSQLILSNPSVGGTGAGQFALVQVPATVAAQESDIVIVRFQPTAAGVYGAYVSFESNTTNTPFSFGVSGFATAFEEVTDRTLSSSIVWEFDFRTGTFFGTLTLCNDADSDKPLWEPFWYLVASNQFHWLRYPDGVETNSGLPYVDVTGAVLAQLPLVGNGDDALDPGECVVVRGIELMGRREATGLVYAIWADPPGPGGLDTDGDGIPDAWEAANSPMSPFNPLDAHLDFDRDGVSNFAEWISGTDPNNPGSVLALTFTSLPDAEGIVLCWPSVAGRVYRIEKAPAVDGLFEPVTGVLNATPPENCVALPGESSDKGMYRIWVSMDEGGLEP